MENEIEKYNSVKSKVVAISKVYQDTTQVVKFSSHLAEKLNNFNPTIMIYGVYNAGKSTLLNAIFGQEEMAKTGDAPETAEVSAYSYNGCTIYDTPGINAPIEHQKITDEHLSKSELIIFVLSNNGSFEEKYIYEKIGAIVKAGKPILIAMNNKSGIDMDSIEAQNELDKVNQHLSTICDEMGIHKVEEKVNIAFVDAKTALEGKIESEQELIDESKIEQFQQTMNNLLGNAGKDEVSNALNLYITDYIEDTLVLIDSKIDNPEMKKTQELITYLEKLKQRVLIELKDMALQTTVMATASLLELMLARDKKSIDEMIQKTTDDMHIRMNQKIEEIQDELKDKITQFKVEFERFSIELPQLDIDIENSEYSNAAQKQHSKAAIAAAGGSLAMIIPPAVIIPTPIGPIPVKPLVMIVSLLFGAFSGSNEARINAEAKLDEKRMQHLSAKNKSDEFGMNLKETLLKSVSANIDNTFANLIQNFVEFSNNLENRNIELLKDKRELLGIVNTL